MLSCATFPLPSLLPNCFQHRWPGASLIVIRGHKHLHECAYIGDDSSEELDEILEAIGDGTYIPRNETTNSSQPGYSRANTPNKMKRHRQEVEFHHPKHKNSTRNHTLHNPVDTTDVTDPEVLRKILASLSVKTGKKAKDEKKEEDDNVAHHVHRNSTIAKGEQDNFAFLKISNNSEELVTDLIENLQRLGAKGTEILDKVNAKLRPSQISEVRDQIEHENNLLDVKGRHYAKPAVKYGDEIDRARRRRRDLLISTAGVLNEHDEENDAGVEEVI